MEIATRNYQEKRNFIRMKVNSPVDVATGGEQLNGTCIDLSGGGMLISIDPTVKQKLVFAPGSRVEVAISSKHGHNPMLKAVTQINRVSQEADQMLVGLEIKELLET